MATVADSPTAVERIAEARRMIELHLDRLEDQADADLMEDISERVYEAIVDRRMQREADDRRRQHKADLARLRADGLRGVRTVKTPILPGGGEDDDRALRDAWEMS